MARRRVGDYLLHLLFDYISLSSLTHPASPTPVRFHRLLEPADACSIPADDFANPRPGTPPNSSAPRRTRCKPSNAARKGAHNWYRSGTDVVGSDASGASLAPTAPRQFHPKRCISSNLGLKLALLGWGIWGDPKAFFSLCLLDFFPIFA